MRHFLFFGALLAGMTMIWGFKDSNSGSPAPYNSTFKPALPHLKFALFEGANFLAPEADTVAHPQILMLNYCTYDSSYVHKTKEYILEYWPNASFTDVWSGSASQLAAVLPGHQMVLITYPANGEAKQIHAIGQVLEQYVRDGGTVVFTGTHKYTVLQQFGLIDLDYGYFCYDSPVEAHDVQHALMRGTTRQTTPINYAYPLDISDPAFHTLADVRGYPVVGEKAIGEGQVLYLGFEYFYDEPYSSRLLANAVRSSLQEHSNPVPVLASNEEIREIAPQTNKPFNSDIHRIKVYPNPYVTKAQVDIELKTEAAVSLVLNDETGRQVAEILTRTEMQPGYYQYELPNLNPGIYFLHYTNGDQQTVRKVVKVSGP